MFWFGDLNFRIDDLDMQVVKSAIDNNKLSVLWEKDQVKKKKKKFWYIYVLNTVNDESICFFWISLKITR